ncbi:unnamed protein product [Heterosigma akashiwo]|mmetsp:Transcript_16765/g.26469  ORF Transcript_16765/g.26469 Transcript_16765/m.26469 type:complete len:106 (+) Transcript_16765:1-318(+)
MDYLMPVMDGPTATSEILKMRPEAKIVGITGNALPDDQATFTQAGAREVLLKPCRKNVLLAAVEKHLALPPAGGPGPAGGASSRAGSGGKTAKKKKGKGSATLGS